MGKGNDQIDPNTYLNLARLQGYVSNPNVITPYGTSYTQWGTFDQAGYDKAMADYQAGKIAEMPDKQNFIQNKDQATIIQALNPLAQAALNNQQNAQFYLSGGAANAARLASGEQYVRPFEYKGPEIKTSIDYQQAGKGPSAEQYGTLSSGPAAGEFGLFGGAVNAPKLQTSLDTSGQISGGPAMGQYGYAQGGPSGPQLQSALDTSRLAAMPVNAGTTAQQAIMSRLQPQLERERAQLQTQLTNQGLVRGGEAYNAAMQEQAQRENDLLTQAAAQGINIDMSARQQGLGEQQALGGFANQAALQQFGAGQQAQQSANAAMQQNYQQALAAAQQGNAAQQQAFNQRVQAGEFGNAAQIASFNAAIQNQQLGNQAIAQNFAQAQAANEARNQAIGQSFGMGQSAQQLANQAAGQNYQQNLGAAQFGNEAISQLYNQQLGLYNQPLITATNFLQASSFQNPNFSTGFQAPNYGNVGTQMQNQANANAAQKNNAISGMMGAGGALIGSYFGQPMAGYAAGSALGRGIG